MVTMLPKYMKMEQELGKQMKKVLGPLLQKIVILKLQILVI